MGKKGLPEWMNSSLWSSSTPPAASVISDRQACPTPKVDPSPPPPPTPPPPSLQPLEPTFVPESTLPLPIKPPNASNMEIIDAGCGNPCSSSIPPAEILRLSPQEISRQSQLLVELSRQIINLDELRRLASQGIPDGDGIRPTVWKLLIGYLPNDRGQWVPELQKKRAQYQAFKEEFLLNPDSEIIEQIDRDVMRTHPDMHFFSGDTAMARSNQESLRNILIIFAKLNPGIRYVQGMNEVLAPLFYVYRNDLDASNAASAEPDAFFCFVELLSGLRDNFCQKLDNSVVGIRSTITRLSQLLKKHDGELWRHLEVTTKVNPQFYAFRWITLLLTQEFNFADALRIWDTLLSDPKGPQESLLGICCAMLILVRRRLLAGDFTSNMKLLQKYPQTNISHLLHLANKLHQNA